LLISISHVMFNELKQANGIPINLHSGRTLTFTYVLN
jgi:hypothetical protein